MKTTYHIKSAEKVPNFATRWRAIYRNFIGSNNKLTKEISKNQQEYEEITTGLNPSSRPIHKPTKNPVKIVKISH